MSLCATLHLVLQCAQCSYGTFCRYGIYPIGKFVRICTFILISNCCQSVLWSQCALFLAICTPVPLSVCTKLHLCVIMQTCAVYTHVPTCNFNRHAPCVSVTAIVLLRTHYDKRTYVPMRTSSQNESLCQLSINVPNSTYAYKHFSCQQERMEPLRTYCVRQPNFCPYANSAQEQYFEPVSQIMSTQANFLSP